MNLIQQLEKEQQEKLSAGRTIPDFEPGDTTRTYRVDIQGSAALLSVDGRFFTSAESTQSPHLAPGPLAIVVGSVAVRIAGLRVYSAP